VSTLLSGALSCHCFTDDCPETRATDDIPLLRRNFVDNLLQAIFFLFRPFTCISVKVMRYSNSAAVVLLTTVMRAANVISIPVSTVLWRPTDGLNDHRPVLANFAHSAIVEDEHI
jgi:hypothetical protein